MPINPQFIDDDKTTRLAKVLYFAVQRGANAEETYDKEDTEHTVEAVAVVSLYGLPDNTLLEMSSQTYWSVAHLCDADIRVINVKLITAVVAMIPDSQYRKWKQDGTEEDRWLLVEKPGLKITQWIL